MLFNSNEFLLFFPTVFAVYWFFFNRNLRLQNGFLVLASYVFYGWWDYRFLSLILISTVVDYLVGLRIEDSTGTNRRRAWLWLSIGVNIGMLGVFKYYGFFIQSWIDAWSVIGYEMPRYSLQIILPVGISFYTFQTLSYSIDIYNRKLRATKDFISFAAFVSFFPQLVAGPIERAKNLLPQILKRRAFKYEQGVQGLRLVLWGMFKKIVIADSLGRYVDDIFTNYSHYDGGVLVLGAIYFSFQIYCDFSGYSDVAIGLAKLLGFDLMTNFRFPYFSRDIAEFWRRWHISLSTWFRDYVYIPLGGSRVGKARSIRNIFVVFVVSGFWHGANWTFLVWGFIHACLFLPLFLLGSNRKKREELHENGRLLPLLKKTGQIGLTFGFVTVAWVFFRNESVTSALSYLSSMNIVYPASHRLYIIYVVLFVICDWGVMNSMSCTPKRTAPYVSNLFFRNAVYSILVLLILLHVPNQAANFIYFQF